MPATRRPQYPRDMTRPLARAVSILGHPALLLPMAALGVALARGDRRSAVWAAAGFAAVTALVMAYSWRQVRRGRWRHVDASERHERAALNRFLLPALAASALLVHWLGGPPAVALGLALSAGIVLAALAGARWCKLSLHLAFAVFAAMLLSKAGWGWMLVALAFAAALAWSRLALQRHVPRDLVAGALAGAVAGVLFWQLFGRMAG